MGVGIFNYNKAKKVGGVGKKIVEGVKKVFGKSSNKNLTPELEALKGFKVSPSGKKDKTKEYKFNLMQKKLKNQINKLKGDK